jgi:vitamin B12 transporter
MRHATTAILLGLAAGPAAAQTITLPDIVVSANRTPTEAAATGSSVSVLTGAELESDGRPFVLDALRDLPGVTVDQSGPPGTATGFAVRGAPARYVRVLVDGIEISDPAGPQVNASLANLLVDDVSRIEVLKGSQSALYGGQAVGGVIDITSPRAEVDGLASHVLLEGGSYDSFRGSYTATGRDARGEFALTIARMQTDGFSAAEEADGNTERDDYATTRVSGSGRYDLTDRLAIFGSAFQQSESGGFDGFDPLTYAPADAPNRYDADSWGLRAGVDLAALDGRLTSTLAASIYAIDRTSDEQEGRFTYHGERTRAEYLGEYRQSDALGWQFGADYTREESRSTSPSDPPSPNETTSVAGVFGQALWQPSEPLTLTLALRHDDHSEFGGYPTGRVTGAYAVRPDTILRASAGTGFRAPSNFELFDPVYGNRDLDPETSRSADIGVEQGFAGGRGSVTAALFWLRIDDLIDFDFATSRYFQTDGTAESRGLELGAGYEVSDRITLSGAYTYTDARDAAGDARLRVPRHSLFARLAGELTQRARFDLGVQYVADLPDEPFTDSASFETSYTVVNARVAYAVAENAEVYLRAENLTDARYQTVEGYSTAEVSFYFGLTGRF